MADASATFALNLEDGMSDGADKAHAAMQRLHGSIDADTKSLNAMNQAMKRVQAAGVVDIATFKQLQGAIDKKKQSIANAQTAIIQLGGSFDKARPKGDRLRSMFEDLKNGAAAAPGPLAGLMSRVGGLKTLMAGGAIALGIVAITAALVALTAVAAGAAAALLKYGVAQADARRNEHLRLEGLTKLRSWYGFVAGNADEMQASIDRVSGSVDVGRDQLGKYTDQLYKMGLRGKNLDAALEGVALKAAVQGESAASAFAGWAAGANLAGQSVQRLTDHVKARLGGIAARQLLSLDAQTRSLHKNFAALFTGLKIEPLLTALSLIPSFFSQATASGRALKAITETLFQPLIDGITAAGPKVERFFLAMELEFLRMTLGLVLVRNWFKRTFGDSEVLKKLDGMTTALWAGKAAAWALAGGLVVAAGAVALIAGAFATLLAVPAALVAIPMALWWVLTTGIPRLAGAAYNIGTDIVRGIVNGIKAGASWLSSALTNLASKAMNAFRAKLGIQSPSKEFAKLGVALPQGVEMGVRKGTPAAQSAVEDLIRVPEVSIPASRGPERAPGAAPAAGVQVAISFGDVIVQSSATDAKGMGADVRRDLEQIFAGLAYQLGAAVGG